MTWDERGKRRGGGREEGLGLLYDQEEGGARAAEMALVQVPVALSCRPRFDWLNVGD